MEYKERYKEVFSQIHPQESFIPETVEMKKMHKSLTKKVVALAAAITLLASFCLTAYATNLFGLRELLLPQNFEAVESEKSQEQDQAVDVISLVGFNNTPEAKAAAEWRTFLASYDPDAEILGQVGNTASGFREDYALYRVYTQEMADKLDEIITKYGLTLHREMIVDLYTNEAICDRVGGNFLGENKAYSAYMFEDGTLKFDGEIDLNGYGRVDYNFMRCVRGSFTDISLNILNVNDYTEWGYVTASGIPVTLALSSYKALIIADLPDSFVTVNVFAGTATPLDANASFNAEALVKIADSFDFAMLTPAKPVTSIDVVSREDTAEEFYQITGLEEREAQAFYAQLVQNIEADNRLAVAEMLHYPVVITHRNTYDADAHLVFNRVERAEDFMAYYDYIFTDTLWWDCIIANQYDRERAKLSADSGMIVGAGGSIRFAKTPNGETKVFSIQNYEECSVRQP